MAVLLKATHVRHMHYGVPNSLSPHVFEKGLLPGSCYTPKAKGYTETRQWSYEGGAEVYCSSTLSLTSALLGDERSTARPGLFTLADRHGTDFTGGWIGPRATQEERSLVPSGSRTPKPPARSKSLYPLSWPVYLQYRPTIFCMYVPISHGRIKLARNRHQWWDFMEIAFN